MISILKMSSMNRWKVAGELHIPKNMTNGSKSPFVVLKAAFHSSPSLILTLLYPDRKSSLVKYLAPFSLSMRSEMRGKGYVSLTVPSFSSL